MVDQLYWSKFTKTPLRKAENVFKSLQWSPRCPRHWQSDDEAHDGPPLHGEAEEHVEFEAWSWHPSRRRNFTVLERHNKQHIKLDMHLKRWTNRPYITDDNKIWRLKKRRHLWPIRWENKSKGDITAEGGATPPNMLKQMSSEIVWKEEKTMDI
jgi:hypothetical protein